MTQEQFDRILLNIIADEDKEAFKRLWKKYHELWGAVIYQKQPDINIYYDKPKEESDNAKSPSN